MSAEERRRLDEPWYAFGPVTRFFSWVLEETQESLAADFPSMNTPTVVSNDKMKRDGNAQDDAKMTSGTDAAVHR
jgi:hypothetical protein